MNESEKEKFRLECLREYRKAEAANARGLRLAYLAAEFACMAQLFTDIMAMFGSTEQLTVYFYWKILLEAIGCLVLGLLTIHAVEKLRTLTDNIVMTE
ncbi:MAG TPA: hypothetical protein DCR21_05025 [Succinivibrionaceae bacterium]|nr:hypothetical protein [Succinivibrionaceae bacterium]